MPSCHEECKAHGKIETAVDSIVIQLARIIEHTEATRKDLTQLAISVESIKRVHERIDGLEEDIENNRLRWEKCRETMDQNGRDIEARLAASLKTITEEVNRHRDQINVWRGFAAAGSALGTIALAAQILNHFLHGGN